MNGQAPRKRVSLVSDQAAFDAARFPLRILRVTRDLDLLNRCCEAVAYADLPVGLSWGVSRDLPGNFLTIEYQNVGARISWDNVGPASRRHLERLIGPALVVLDGLGMVHEGIPDWGYQRE